MMGTGTHRDLTMRGLLMVDATDLPRLCEQRGWTNRARLMLELRGAARRMNRGLLPDDTSLKRMIREWVHGRRGLSQEYADLFAEVFGVPFAIGKPGMAALAPVADGADLAARLSAAETLDSSLVTLLEAQTDSYRAIDRQLGAGRLLQQTEAHVAQMTDLWRYALPGPHREALAAAVAEAAALGGWQALDLGDAHKAWSLHETAKSAARESGSPSIVAHVTAQQAYALLDLDRPQQAVSLIQHARTEADGQVPAMLRSWLWAAEAEGLAASGAAGPAQVALDQAGRALPGPDEGDGLPYLFLNDVHLARWRGHCLARLGKVEAVQELTDAVKRLDPTFTRAAAGLRCDLALAYSVRGQHEEARAEARAAEALATRASSTRQRRRIVGLLTSGAGQSDR
ncbi:XRE family transcriptional regulator [Actinoplanes sp. NPDC026619]|uniref:XRE family transcriptional regulator n=1 Tax=Actinoplanes sp. NPDC026619 TaxID=3155798 RepID=UPI0033EB9827